MNTTKPVIRIIPIKMKRTRRMQKKIITTIIQKHNIGVAIKGLNDLIVDGMNLNGNMRNNSKRGKKVFMRHKESKRIQNKIWFLRAWISKMFRDIFQHKI